MMQNNEQTEEVLEYFRNKKYYIDKKDIRKIIYMSKYLKLTTKEIIKEIELTFFVGLVDPEM